LLGSLIVSDSNICATYQVQYEYLVKEIAGHYSTRHFLFVNSIAIL
jgi:hypothetical protein